MDLVGVRVEIPANTPMMLLRERNGKHRILPIYIGNPEAAAIHAAMEGIEPPRPMTHDLMRTVIDALGGVWESVNITEVRDHTFFAEIVLTTSDGQTLHISARPSDACALAIRANVPIFAADDVLADAGRTDDDDTSEEGTAEIIDEFQSFLENVNPEDFAP